MNLTCEDSSLSAWIPRWQSSHLQFSEADTTEADELLCVIGQAIQPMVQTQKLQRLLAWANQVALTSQESSHPTAKRAAAIALVLDRAIALAHAHARGSDRANALELSNILNHALNHARKIVAKLKNRFSSDRESDLQMHELSRDFTQQVAQTWFDGQFDPNLVALSPREAQALNRYLHASEWIVDCIDARIGISRCVWETVVDQLIQPLG